MTLPHPSKRLIRHLRRAPIPRCEGMTLIELLIVMALMAGLATFALTSMGDLSARSRFDVTRDRMEKIRLAIEGDGVRTGRFIADMGRLPLQLDELWSQGANSKYARQQRTYPINGGSDLSFSLYCGWNGPYIVPQGTHIHDGFGVPFTYTANNLISSGHVHHASWLPGTVTNTLRIPACSLHIVVKAPQPCPGGFVWAPVESAAATTRLIPFTNGGIHQAHLFYADSGTTNVYLCLKDNTDMTPTDVPDNWLKATRHVFFSVAEALLALPNESASDINIVSSNLLISLPPSEVVFTNLAPGIRQIAAHAFYTREGVTNYAVQSDIQSIELRPGPNFITLYLNHESKP